MTISITTNEAERARRAEFIREARAASLQSESPEQRTKKREAKADAWAQWFRQKMDEGGCADPVELLPDALARLEQTIDDRITAATVEIKAAVRKAFA
jgi:hypothetical protein